MGVAETGAAGGGGDGAGGFAGTGGCGAGDDMGGANPRPAAARRGGARGFGEAWESLGTERKEQQDERGRRGEKRSEDGRGGEAFKAEQRN